MSDQGLGISVRITDPLWFPERQSHGVFISEVIELSHVIDADGGYKSANITLALMPLMLEKWLERGLGCHVEISSPSLQVIGEYFINSMTVTINGWTVTIGPLMRVGNRVKVLYTPYTDITVDPWTTGTQTETLYASDAASQTRYGIQEAMVNGGTLIDSLTTTGTAVYDAAINLRDTYLAENKEPGTERQELDPNTGALNGISFDCLGYYAWLDKYEYVAAGPGYTTIRDKIIAALAYSPNAFGFVTDTSGISSNPGLATLADSGRTAMSVVEELRNFGDGSGNRMTLGVYNNRKVFYTTTARSAQVWGYEYHLYKQPAGLRLRNGNLVHPWDVVPARWVFIPDFMIGRIPDDTPRFADPRFMFVESVTYTAPYGVNLTGSRTLKLPQILARGGLM